MGGLEKKLKNYLLFALFSLSIEGLNRPVFVIYFNFFSKLPGYGGLKKKLKSYLLFASFSLIIEGLNRTVFVVYFNFFSKLPNYGGSRKKIEMLPAICLVFSLYRGVK